MRRLVSCVGSLHFPAGAWLAGHKTRGRNAAAVFGTHVLTLLTGSRIYRARGCVGVALFGLPDTPHHRINWDFRFKTSEVEAMKFRPLHDRVVVRRIEEDTKSAGGIIIPDTAKEKPVQGEIIAVGPGARDEQGKLVPLDVKKGDKVLFGKWSGTEVKIDGEELLIMKESDILGVVEGKANIRAAA